MLGDDEVSNSRVTLMIMRYKEEMKIEPLTSRKIKALKTTLMTEAQQAYQKGSYEVAIDKFAQLSAITEDEKKKDEETIASLRANFGSCLHNLHEFEYAKIYYKQGLEGFEKLPTSKFTWLLYGDVNAKRINYIKARLTDLAIEKLPDKSKYLDSYGAERQWSKSEMSAQGSSAWEWVSPSSWYHWARGYEPSEKSDLNANQSVTAA